MQTFAHTRVFKSIALCTAASLVLSACGAQTTPSEQIEQAVTSSALTLVGMDALPHEVEETGFFVGTDSVLWEVTVDGTAFSVEGRADEDERSVTVFGPGGQQLFRSILTHELGHCMGFRGPGLPPFQKAFSSTAPEEDFATYHVDEESGRKVIALAAAVEEGVLPLRDGPGRIAVPLALAAFHDRLLSTAQSSSVQGGVGTVQQNILGAIIAAVAGLVAAVAGLVAVVKGDCNSPDFGTFAACYDDSGHIVGFASCGPCDGNATCDRGANGVCTGDCYCGD